MINKQELVSRVAGNLGLDEVKRGSYLYNLLDGLHAATELVVQEVQDEVKNMSIDTMDEDTLERKGELLGIPRLKERYIAIRSSAQDMRITAVFYKETEQVLELFKAGEVISDGFLDVVFTKDILFDPKVDNYIDANIQLHTSYEQSMLREGTRVAIPIPTRALTVIRELYLEPLKDKVFSSEVEDIATYRKRVANHKKPSTITELLRSHPYVDSFYIDHTKAVPTVYVASAAMYAQGEDSYFVDNIIPLISALINAEKPYGVDYNVQPAEKVEMTIESKAPEDVLTERTSEYLIAHSIGYDSFINASLFGGAETKIYLEFDGYRELYGDEILLKSYQYPYIPRVRSTHGL